MNDGLYDIREDHGYQYIDNGTTKIELDLNNKTYTLKAEPGEEPYHTPYSWATFLEAKLKAFPEKIRLLPATSIDGIACWHIMLVLKDLAR